MLGVLTFVPCLLCQEDSDEVTTAVYIVSLKQNPSSHHFSEFNVGKDIQHGASKRTRFYFHTPRWVFFSYEIYQKVFFFFLTFSYFLPFGSLFCVVEWSLFLPLFWVILWKVSALVLLLIPLLMFDFLSTTLKYLTLCWDSFAFKIIEASWVS